MNWKDEVSDNMGFCLMARISHTAVVAVALAMLERLSRGKNGTMTVSIKRIVVVMNSCC